MNILIVGCGFGDAVYRPIYERAGSTIIRVDPDVLKFPDYTSVEQIPSTMHFDIAHICVPNYLHEDIAEKIAAKTDIVFVEKPGVQSQLRWNRLVGLNPNTRITMTKNNMWRKEIPALIERAAKTEIIDIEWRTKNRVPRPGSWFTEKAKSLGGISKDILPHLASIMIALAGANWEYCTVVENIKRQVWDLKTIAHDGSDYGPVNENGVYDVDDTAKIVADICGKTYILDAAWKTNEPDRIGIFFNGKDFFPLGLCPEEAYESMILDCLHNFDNEDFWYNQYKIDRFLHTL
jgi:predicted dehydrogenase